MLALNYVAVWNKIGIWLYSSWPYCSINILKTNHQYLRLNLATLIILVSSAKVFIDGVFSELLFRFNIIRKFLQNELSSVQQCVYRVSSAH